jgi:hypothetical protein
MLQNTQSSVVSRQILNDQEMKEMFLTSRSVRPKCFGYVVNSSTCIIYFLFCIQYLLQPKNSSPLVFVNA